MKLYIDIPNNFVSSHYHNYAEVRGAYCKIISAAIRMGLQLELFKTKPFICNELNSAFADGIYYAYHAKQPREQSYCIKPGALPNLWYFDPAGYSGWSRIANSPEEQEASASFAPERAVAALELYRSKFAHENFSAIQQPEKPLEDQISDVGNFIFYPLQVNTDEVLKLGQFTQIEILKRVADLAQEHRMHVVLKRHPMCDSLPIKNMVSSLAGHPFVHISDSSVHKLIEASRCILVSNSGVGLQALIHGKTVYSLARSEYAHMTLPIASLDDIARVFVEPIVEQTQRVQAQLGYLLEEYWVDVTSEDKIAARIRSHVSDFDKGELQRCAELSRKAGNLSMLHRAEKELGDIVDLILLGYRNLSDKEKDVSAHFLAKVASSGAKVDSILRQTDSRVWWKCLAAFRQTDLQRAADLLRRIAEAHPGDCRSLLAYSKILYEVKNDSLGLKYAKLAAASSNSSAEALVFLGRKQLKKKESAAEVLGYADKAIALDPSHSKAYWLKSRAYFVLNDKQNASGAISRALELEPDNAAYLELSSKVGTMQVVPPGGATTVQTEVQPGALPGKDASP